MIKISKKINRFLSGSIKASGWSDHLTVLGRKPKLLSKSPHLKWRLASSHLKERLIWSLLAQTPPSAAQHKQLQKPISQMGSWPLLISVYYGPQKKPKPTKKKKKKSTVKSILKMIKSRFDLLKQHAFFSLLEWIVSPFGTLTILRTNKACLELDPEP